MGEKVWRLFSNIQVPTVCFPYPCIWKRWMEEFCKGSWFNVTILQLILEDVPPFDHDLD